MAVSLTNTVMILFQPAAPASPATPEPEAPAPPVVDPAGTAPVSQQGQTRPALLPSSTQRASDHAPAAAALVLLLAVGAAALV